MPHRSGKSPFVTIALAAALLVLLVAGLAACGSSFTTTTAASASSAAGARELTVSAASSLKSAFTEIGKAFDAANDSKTIFNFDA